SSFFQVTFNLLDNAVKYAHEDPSQFCIQIWAERLVTGIEIYFEDNGIGIPSESREWVFRRGARLQQRSGPFGNGLGLWAVRRIVERHGGSIRIVDPRRGGVTCFAISLPPSAVHQEA
ncbi:MAG: sensor histidine kinase, partial [Bryobacterales bacterium]|nr:sensor histidine kinase [Bryobacterales bacterium]